MESASDRTGRRADSACPRTRFRANRSLVSTPIPRSCSRLNPSSLELTRSFATVLGISSCRSPRTRSLVPRRGIHRDERSFDHSLESRKIPTNENCHRKERNARVLPFPIIFYNNMNFIISLLTLELDPPIISILFFI